MKRFYIFLYFAFFCVLSSLAQQKKINGITYKVIAPGEVKIYNVPSLSYNIKASGHVIIPETVEISKKQYNVVRVGDSAFEKSSNITGITLPGTIKSIEQHAFHGCNRLVEVNLPSSLERIDDSAFSGCTSLKSIKFPNALKEIGRFAFYDCYLSEIIIPESVDSVGENAFWYNNYLKTIKLPNKDIKWGKNVF